MCLSFQRTDNFRDARRGVTRSHADCAHPALGQFTGPAVYISCGSRSKQRIRGKGGNCRQDSGQDIPASGGSHAGSAGIRDPGFFSVRNDCGRSFKQQDDLVFLRV